MKHKFRSLAYNNGYIDDFSDLPLDVNGDGHMDIVSCAWFIQEKVMASGSSTRSIAASPSSLPSWWIWITTARRERCCRSTKA